MLIIFVHFYNLGFIINITLLMLHAYTSVILFLSLYMSLLNCVRDRFMDVFGTKHLCTTAIQNVSLHIS